MNDYIGKPISYDDLTIKVEKWLRRGQNVVDDSALAHLAKLGEKANKNLLRELVQVFIEDSNVAFIQMRQAIQEARFEDVARVAHTLKSSCSNLGVMRMRDLALWIEQSAKNSTSKQLSILVDTIQREFDDAAPVLKQRVDEVEKRIQS
jgi:HPt (histidine-containing phosphotransfer) domain-containing protein